MSSSVVTWLLAGFFVPLFPFSMLFNRLFARCGSPGLRGLCLLLWPQAGLVLLTAAAGPVPRWLAAWGLATAALYAFRALVLREVGVWTGFLATSAWAVLWAMAAHGVAPPMLHAAALAFSVPLALLALLVGGLERRYGAAFADLCDGLAGTIPRFAAVLVLVVLAVVATPVFPGFFAMLAAVVVAAPAAPLMALVLVLVWFLWSWAGIRLLQGLVNGPRSRNGPPGAEQVPDLDRAAAAGYLAMLGTLAVTGLYYAVAAA